MVQIVLTVHWDLEDLDFQDLRVRQQVHLVQESQAVQVVQVDLEIQQTQDHRTVLEVQDLQIVLLSHLILLVLVDPMVLKVRKVQEDLGYQFLLQPQHYQVVQKDLENPVGLCLQLVQKVPLHQVTH